MRWNPEFFMSLNQLEQEIYFGRFLIWMRSVQMKKMPAPTQMRIIGLHVEPSKIQMFIKEIWREVLKLRRATVSEVLRDDGERMVLFQERLLRERDTRVKKVVLNQMTNR